MIIENEREECSESKIFFSHLFNFRFSLHQKKKKKTSLFFP